MNTVRLALLSLLLVVPVACRDRLASEPATTTSTTATASTTEATTAPTTTSVAVQAASGRSDGSLQTPDGRIRTFHVYLPDTLPEGSVPLVVALHGGTGSGQQFERSSGLDAQADEHGFIVVYPDGVGSSADETELRTWNARLCCGSAARKDVDDVGFIGLLIDQMEATYAIDPAKVYAVGHSNGGFMAYRLACELSDRIVAVGLQAGGLGVDTCEPERPVSLLHLHGRQDTNVPIEGGLGTGISKVAFPPLDDSLDTVSVAMGCDASPVESVDGIVTTRTWAGCDGGVTVEVQLVAGHDHKWMKGDFDAASTIVEFLLAH